MGADTVCQICRTSPAIVDAAIGQLHRIGLQRGKKKNDIPNEGIPTRYTLGYKPVPIFSLRGAGEESWMPINQEECDDFHGNFIVIGQYGATESKFDETASSEEAHKSGELNQRPGKSEIYCFRGLQALHDNFGDCREVVREKGNTVWCIDGDDRDVEDFSIPKESWEESRIEYTHVCASAGCENLVHIQCFELLYGVCKKKLFQS